jgi:hypothetical protein
MVPSLLIILLRILHIYHTHPLLAIRRSRRIRLIRSLIIYSASLVVPFSFRSVLRQYDSEYGCKGKTNPIRINRLSVFVLCHVIDQSAVIIRREACSTVRQEHRRNNGTCELLACENLLVILSNLKLSQEKVILFTWLVLCTQKHDSDIYLTAKHRCVAHV